MAVSTALISAGVTGYGIYKQSQQKSPTLADLNPPNPAHEQMQADVAAVNAGVAQKKKAGSAKGFSSTILTGPQGVQNNQPSAIKTLLGQ